MVPSILAGVVDQTEGIVHKHAFTDSLGNVNLIPSAQTWFSTRSIRRTVDIDFRDQTCCLLAATLDVYGEEGVRRVLRRYGPTSFSPMSNDDPVVLSQPGETMEDKQTAAYDECHLLRPMAKVWLLAGPSYKSPRGESLPGPCHVLNSADHTIPLSEIAKPPLGDIQKLHLEDVVREAVPLEVGEKNEEDDRVSVADE
ncbi:hypothetical protein IFM46972_03074 [Aspergillus udagawae]|uniref:Uncharacterized protein n=1 Tax=Aspergillus udagawae TaxID=91492 RepID=A0A8H3RSN6_9EURO|nr:hypothetical protein IFM46972_03074 [Aspergillus udagawae]